MSGVGGPGGHPRTIAPSQPRKISPLQKSGPVEPRTVLNRAILLPMLQPPPPIETIKTIKTVFSQAPNPPILSEAGISGKGS